jgi:hypothetical protein
LFQLVKRFDIMLKRSRAGGAASGRPAASEPICDLKRSTPSLLTAHQ